MKYHANLVVVLLTWFPGLSKLNINHYDFSSVNSFYLFSGIVTVSIAAFGYTNLSQPETDTKII